MSAKQTPLPDLLDQVPEDIVLGIPGDEPVFPSYTNIPIGRLARQAAAELRCLHAENKRLSWDSIHTCHAECQRPVCRLTRERDALLEALRKHVYLHDKDCVCEDCAAIDKAEGENHAKNL